MVVAAVVAEVVAGAVAVAEKERENQCECACCLKKADRLKSRARNSLSHCISVKTQKKLSVTDGPTDQRTDRPTDRPTNGPTDTVTHRVACSRMHATKKPSESYDGNTCY